MTITIKCFKNIADMTSMKEFTGDSYQALVEHPSPSQAKDGSEYARVILNPNHDDPRKSLQVHVRAGDRNGTDPLRFERVEVYEVDEDGSAALTWYGDCEGGNKLLDRTQGLTFKSPTFEEYTDAGYRPASYPPRGHKIVPSEGYTDYLAHKQSVNDAWDEAHGADAVTLQNKINNQSQNKALTLEQADPVEAAQLDADARKDAVQMETEELAARKAKLKSKDKG